MRLYSTSWFLAAVSLVACAGTPEELAAPAGAPPPRWDQERVTALAEELRAASDDLYAAYLRDPAPESGTGFASGVAVARHRLRQSLRLLKTEATHLAASLEAGEGRDETLPIFRHLESFVDRATEDARSAFLNAELLDHVAAVGSALMRIEPYYDPRALLDPPPEGQQARPERSGDSA